MFEDVGSFRKDCLLSTVLYRTTVVYGITLVFVGLGCKLDCVCKRKRMFKLRVNPLRDKFIDTTVCCLEMPRFFAKM